MGRGGMFYPAPVLAARAGPERLRVKGRAQRGAKRSLDAETGPARPGADVTERSEGAKRGASAASSVPCRRHAPRSGKNSGGLRSNSASPPARSNPFQDPNHRAARIVTSHSEQDQALSISLRRESRAIALPKFRSTILGSSRGPIRHGGSSPATGVRPGDRPGCLRRNPVQTSGELKR